MEPVTPDSTTQTIINWLLGGFVGLLSALAAIYRKKIDDLQDGHTQLLSTYVTREELTRHLDSISQARTAMHSENTRKLERIEDGLSRIHERIDEIPYRSTGARTRSSDPVRR
jgi:hypothetical protein